MTNDNAASANVEPGISELGSAKPSGTQGSSGHGTSIEATSSSEKASTEAAPSLMMLSPREEALLIERALSRGAQEAAQKHLAEGRPIYYRDEEYGKHLVKEVPGGQRFYVGLGEDYEEIVYREIPARAR